MNTKAMNPRNHLKVLLWSASGSGKTTFAGTFPKPYFFDFDQRMEVLRGRDIEFDTYDKKDYKLAKAKLDELTVLGAKGQLPYETIVLDSLTSFDESAMAVSLDQTSRMFPTLKRVTDDTGTRVPVMQDYQGEQHFVMNFVRCVRSLPAHVVCIAHQHKDVDPDTKQITHSLALGRTLAALVPNAFNEIWRMEPVVRTEHGKAFTSYRVMTHKDATTLMCRTAYPHALDQFEDADFASIFAKIQKLR